MLDFVEIKIKTTATSKVLTVYPEFIVNNSNDLMIKGHEFYAVWDEEAGHWSTDENDIIRLIDKATMDYVHEHIPEGTPVSIKLLRDNGSGKWREWKSFCKYHIDKFHLIDSRIVFANQEIKKNDYISRKLPYPLEECSISAYDEIISTLYDPVERKKIEWAIGSIIAGDSKTIQKFIVFYGTPGSGKSTILNIIQMLFDGYYEVFDSAELGNRNSSFALEPFRNNPLIAIEHEGDLSRIETNTRLNSIVSHEKLEVNEKFKNLYSFKFHSFLILSTNKPVRITDAKSGILRRLIDINPTGNLIEFGRYNNLMGQVEYELGGIAKHCLDVYMSMGPNYYSSYVPLSMMSKTNDVFNFIEDNYLFFSDPENDKIYLSTAWLRYKEYCDEARIQYPLSKRAFKEELKNYFRTFKSHDIGGWNIYSGFIKEKFDFYEPDAQNAKEVKEIKIESWLKFDSTVSVFDEEFKECLAQYANEEEKPNWKWDNVKTKLKDLDTSKIHYVKLPLNAITIDFDLKDANGNKSLELNMAAASKFPPTYAEVSKSGSGIHLHYIYNGDVETLNNLYDTDIEIKKSIGNSSLRRRLSKCNDLPIRVINSGLPLKERKNMTNDLTIQDEKHLRNLIKKGLLKKVFPNTKPSVDYIAKILDDAYKSGMKYDVTDMAPDIQQFAMSSSHQAQICLKIVNKMKFKSDEPGDAVLDKRDGPLIFFDVEVFPNLFIICWKKDGGKDVVRMINPTATQVEEVVKGSKLVGFNNRRYDNHILWAAMMGYTTEQLFKLSSRIINDNDRNALFGEAYNLSYTDVYDFLSSSNKMGLKKWEIKLKIHHVENAYPWDQPVDEKYWQEIADYCCNDVIATEEVFYANQADWEAREMLAELSGLTVNDTTNQHTTRIIVGTDRRPQDQFIYTDLSTIYPGYEFNATGIEPSRYAEGAKIVSGKSIYKGKDPGEGGYAIGYPGIYTNITLLDVESMHPHSAIWLKIFGEKYTKQFEEIVKARLAIKHKDYELAGQMLDGKLKPYLKDPKDAKKVANALKTAINSVYGLTSAPFDNKLRDPRNVDNIVAKYGALFMINLEEEVTKRGFTVVHIKTDSIKIANATPEIIEFCKEYAKGYGFTFNHEATYEKMCIINDAVYIAKYAKKDWCEKAYGYIPEENAEHEEELAYDDKGRYIGPWTATGKQFQVPYVFKTLFSHEKIEFDDMCEVFNTNSALYLDMGDDQNHDYKFIGKIGEFVPIKEGAGGGVLYREQDGKYNSVAGTKKQGKIPKGETDVYYWLDSETVQLLHKEKDIDESYYRALVDAAVDTISNFGDFEQFVA